MDILSTEDLLTVIKQEHIDELTADFGGAFDYAEPVAVGEITGYLNVRYKAEDCFDRALMADYSAIATVLNKLVDVCLYHVHARVMPNNIPELRQERYDNAINWLEKVASGYIAPKLPIKDADPTGPLRFGNSSETEDRYF